MDDRDDSKVGRILEALPNPFQVIKTEQFDNNYPIISTLFQRIWNPDHETIMGRTHVILEGGRGSGKTMVLKYLSLETQLAELTRKGVAASSYPNDFVGVYFKIDPGPFDLVGSGQTSMPG